MIKLSEAPSGEPLHTVLIVAFDAVSGQVHSTFVHASYGEDAPGVARSRQRLLKDLRSQLGAKAKLESVTLPSGKMPVGSVRRVEPKTRKLVIDERDLNSRGGAPVAATRARKKTKTKR